MNKISDNNNSNKTQKSRTTTTPTKHKNLGQQQLQQNTKIEQVLVELSHLLHIWNM